MTPRCPVWERVEAPGGEVLAQCSRPVLSGGQHCTRHANKRDYR